jgi:hypothetical protein
MNEGGGPERGPLDFDDDDPHGERRWAHRRDPDLERPERGARRAPVPVPRPPGMSRYTWFLGVVAVLLIALVTINSIRSGGGGSQGVVAGHSMPPFATPLALSGLDGDANVARKAGQGAAGDRPACDVRGPEILNGCQLWEQGPVVLAFFATRGGRCIDQLDAIERLRARFPRVRFAAVAVRGDRDEVRGLVRGHHWGFPVGYDRDGALANVYHVAVCPQITFARRGGRVVDTTFGRLSDAELAAQVRRLAG